MLVIKVSPPIGGISMACNIDTDGGASAKLTSLCHTWLYFPEPAPRLLLARLTPRLSGVFPNHHAAVLSHQSIVQIAPARWRLSFAAPERTPPDVHETLPNPLGILFT